jgi:hypothetical protein
MMPQLVSFAPWLCGGLFLGMLVLLEAGRRIGERRLTADPDGARIGVGAVEGAVFALLGLLIAFTFSGAASRFEGRRELVIEEANAIGTAWLRLDLLPANAQPSLRDLFRQYVDSRLETYRKLPAETAAEEELARSTALQGQIWRQAVAACEAKRDPPTTSLLLPALNAMIDITTTRTMVGRHMHPPAIVFALLGGLVLGGALLVGYGMAGGKRNWLHVLSFTSVMAVTTYVILDIEYPRLGLIRVDAVDEALVEVRESMK